MAREVLHMTAMMTDSLNDGAESQMLIGRVVNGPLGAVRLNQRVRTVHIVAASMFPGFLVIAGMWILDGVAEFVINRCLYDIEHQYIEIIRN